jgi:hypothetical protein
MHQTSGRVPSPEDTQGRDRVLAETWHTDETSTRIQRQCLWLPHSAAPRLDERPLSSKK